MAAAARAIQHEPAYLKIVHPLERAHQTLDYAGKLTSGFRAVAASRVYRGYGLMNLLEDTLPANRAGNFRGMVLSARWKTAFHYVSEHGETLENVGTLVSLGANLAEMGPELEAVHHSGADATTKGLRYASLAGTAAQRTLAGMVTGGVHLTYMSMQGYCMMLGLFGGQAEAAANSCISTLKVADSFVLTSVKMITDTSQQANAIYHPREAAKSAYWWVVNMQFMPKP